MKNIIRWYKVQPSYLRLVLTLIGLTIFYVVFNLIFQQNVDWTGPLFLLVAGVLATIVLFFKIKVRWAWLIYFIGGTMTGLAFFAHNSWSLKVIVFSLLIGFIMAIGLSVCTLAAYEQEKSPK
ncbi:hypothetical protein [Bombilactobacillus bombi]|uniref:hypothetical protein n=1 Tax=Bombilactobacillus bombi TaxID=1303590 RepID=UPI0015E5B36A|nr:hypothetical protein [Bombilactobacillus bombi]MBA1434657.1 hypothetical protein [Bombilactobacillus bombi]